MESTPPPDLTGLSCPICSIAMILRLPVEDGDVFTCPGCIGIVGVVGIDCVALAENELRQLRVDLPQMVAELEARRIELAKLWAAQGHAPTIFGVVAAQMYLQSGEQSLLLPR